MTSLNLATIFGPNLLHKQKNSDKEFAVQSLARAEESTAIIGVVQQMINAYDTLFMVSRPCCKPKVIQAMTNNCFCVLGKCLCWIHKAWQGETT